jgi:ComEC/Rec2-related protein
MVVEREYVGIEPFFAVGVLVSAISTASFTQIYHVSAASQAMAFILLAASCLLKHRGYTGASRIMLTLAILSAGCFCSSNSILLDLGDGEHNGYISRIVRHIGLTLQYAIDAIPFKDPDTSALLKALVSGNRNELPKHITEAFRISGASHILALSGLHLGIIYTMISKATCILGNRQHIKVFRSISNIAFCTIYTLATGASASMTRALLFIILRETGKMTDRPADLSSLLRKSMLIQLVISPHDILDIGFQLSYAAMAGIVWIYPPLNNIMDEEGSDRLIKKIWSSATLSISCQLTTLPLTWHYFGTFPPYFMLTNLLALPLTGIMMPLAAITVFLSHLGVCPEIMMAATEKLTESLVFILETISEM